MKLRRAICGVVALSLSSASVYVPVAQAALVGTGQAVQEAQGQLSAQQARDKLSALLQRDDLAAELRAHGVDPLEAQQRVASMTDAEVQQLAGRIEQLPAGGDVLGVAVLIFLVLLFTDIMGWTNIFPFVKHGSGAAK